MPTVEHNGCDSVIFTVAAPGEVLARVIASALARWPDGLVCEWDGPRGGRPLAGFSAVPPPDGRAQLQFYRDAGMLRRMETAPYAPGPDGEGPFAVLTRVRRDVEIAAAGVSERRAADRGGPRPPEPYAAWLCAAALTEVTAVTPGDPSSSAFASWVLEEVKRACRAPTRDNQPLQRTGREWLR